MSRFLLAALFVAIAPAAGHETGLASDDAAASSFKLPIVLQLAAVAILYAIGAIRVWRRAGFGHGLRTTSFLLFTAGWLVLVAALRSPLDSLSGQLFTAHMIEHELLMGLAAPLLVAARPLGILLWALPRAWRHTLGQMAQSSMLSYAWNWLTAPLVATVLHGVAIWVWHAPALFRKSLTHDWVHWLQHASFLGTGLLFWWAMFSLIRRRQPAAIGHLFVTSVHTSLLGALLAFSPRAWFEFQSIGAPAFGLTALQDQQLAGLVMWIPGGMSYFGAALYGGYFFIERRDRLDGPRECRTSRVAGRKTDPLELVAIRSISGPVVQDDCEILRVSLTCSGQKPLKAGDV
jgi:putative membrane protein